MTNYIGLLGVSKALDHLEKRLGMDWIKSPYTKLEDVIAPDDPDMKIILELRRKVKSSSPKPKTPDYPRRRRSDSSTHRLAAMRNDIKAQIQGGWTREKIAKAAGVSPATMTNFIHADLELNALFKSRGRMATKPDKTLQVIQLHEQGINSYQIRKQTGLDHKVISGIIAKYEADVLTAESLKQYN